ncbi:MAG: hypothetical protein FJX74_11830 [Armatimonadetes bacterium]|nr:hypothetical protein [Armatimonadota bacterium]
MRNHTRPWRLRLGLLIGLAVAASTVLGAASLSSLVPASNEIPGWKALQADTAATSPAELWKIYDGGDGPWKQAGVTSAFQRYYKHQTTGKVVTLILHNTGGDWQKAKALYRSKNGNIAGQPGYQAVTLEKEGALATPGQGVQGHSWNKYYYCTVTVNGTSAAEVSAAKLFLQKTAAKIAASG